MTEPRAQTTYRAPPSVFEALERYRRENGLRSINEVLDEAVRRLVADEAVSEVRSDER